MWLNVVEGLFKWLMVCLKLNVVEGLFKIELG